MTKANKGQFQPKDAWDAATEAWLMKSIAAGITQKSLYRRLIDQMPGRPDDVPAWHGEYETFKKRAKKLTSGNAAGLRDHKKKATQKKLKAINIDSVAGQLEFLRTLITDITLSADAKMKAFDRFVEM